MVDIFAHEYGWSINQIYDLTFLGAICLMERIKARYPQEKKGIDTSKIGLSDLMKEMGG